MSMIVVCSIESVHTEQHTFMYVMSKYGSSRVEVVVVVVVVVVLVAEVPDIL